MLEGVVSRKVKNRLISFLNKKKNIIKRKQILVSSVSRFLTMFSKCLFFRVVQTTADKELKSLPDDKILAWSKLKALADDK